MTYFKKIGICLIAGCGLFAGLHGSAHAAGEWIADANGCKVWNPFPTPEESITWSGACEQGYANGVGTLQWFKAGKPLEKYEGSYKDGRRTGKGNQSFSSGGRYEGDWLDEQRTGKGVYTWAQGRYEGDFVDGQITGKGHYLWSDGERYEGGVKNGLKQGAGILTIPSSKNLDFELKKFVEKVGNAQVIRAIFENNKPVIDCSKQTLDQCEWWNQNRERIAKEKDSGQCPQYIASIQEAESRSGGLGKPGEESCYANGIKNGTGTIFFAKGGRYEGRLENGGRRGPGAVILPRGSSYISGWERKNQGQWVGDNYVIRAVFASDGDVLYDCRNSTAEQCDWFGVNREDYREKLYTAEKAGACKQVAAIFAEARTRSGSLFRDYMDEPQSISRCEENARFGALVVSKAPRPMYLGAVAYEDKSERSRAKTLYRELMSRFPNSNEALLAGQRLSQLGDVEAMETSAANAARASYQAAESMKSQNYDQCVANRNACYSRCSPLKGSAQSKCEQGCAVCSR